MRKGQGSVTCKQVPLPLLLDVEFWLSKWDTQIATTITITTTLTVEFALETVYDILSFLFFFSKSQCLYDFILHIYVFT
jgi:hypothetical protein